MKTLLLKLFRDIKMSIGGFISIIFVIGIGSMFFTGLSSSTTSIKNLVDKYYEDYNFSDYTAYFSSVTYEDLENIKNIDKIELRHSFDTKLYINSVDTDLRVHTMPKDINKLYIHEGNLPKEGEIVLDSSYGKLNNIKIGDVLDFKYGDMDFSLKVSGFINSPEYIYKAKDETTLSFDFGKFGVGYIDEDTLKNKFNESNASFFYTEGLIDTESLVDEGTFKDIPTFMALVSKSDQMSNVYFNNALDQIDGIIVVFPLIFFLVASIITFISMSKTIDNQRTQIGIMGALGFSSGRIYFIYILYSSIAAIFGSLIGGFIGMVSLPNIILKTFDQQFILPITKLQMYPMYILYAFIISLVFSLISTVISCHKTLVECPANTLRPKAPKRSKHMIIERFKVFNKIPFVYKIIVRNIFYNKMRIILSSIGIIGSIMFLIMGFSLKFNLSKMISYEETSRNYSFEVELLQPKEEEEILSYSDSIKGVDLISKMQGTFKKEGKDDLRIPIIGVEGDNETIVLKNKKGDPITFNNSSVVIPTKVSMDYDLSIGDTINIKVNLGSELKDINLKITDIGEMYSALMIYVSQDILKDQGIEPIRINGFVNLKDGSDIKEVSNHLKENENVNKVMLVSDTTTKVKDLMNMMNIVILIIIVGAAVLAISIVYNITSINILERTREIATLLVLGYYDKEINRLIFIENIFLSIFGGIIGIPFGIWLTHYMQASIRGRGVVLPEGAPIVSIIISFILVMIFSLFTNLLLRRKVLKINMIEALKGVE